MEHYLNCHTAFTDNDKELEGVGSVAKNTCSWGEPGFTSQHQHGSYSSRGSGASYWPPQASGTHVVHTYTCKQNTHTYKNMSLKRKKEWQNKKTFVDVEPGYTVGEVNWIFKQNQEVDSFPMIKFFLMKFVTFYL